MRFGHLVPMSARRPSAVYLRSLESPLLVDGDGDLDDYDAESNEQPAGMSADPDEQGLTGRSHRRDTLVTTAVGLGTYGLSLFTGPLLARALSTADRGTYAAVWGPTQIIGWLLMLGVPAAATYYARQDNRRQLEANAWLVTLIVGVPVVLMLWPLVPLFLHKHPPMAVFWFRMFLVVMLLLLPTYSSFEYLRARGHNLKFNVYRSLPLVLTTVFVVGLFVAGMLNLRNALYATLIGNLLGAGVVLVVEGSFPRVSAGLLDRKLLKLQLHYGTRVWFGTLSNMVLARFDQILMVSIVDRDQLGLYAIAVTGAGLSAPVAQGVGYALFPFLRRDSDPQARDVRMWQAFRWVLAGSLAICGGLAVIAPWGIPALFGADYRDSLPALYVLLPGQLFWNLGLVFKTRLEADNRPGSGSNALAIAAGMTLVGVPLIVPHWGILGASVVTSVSQATFCAAGLWFVRRGLRTDLAAEALTQDLNLSDAETHEVLR